MDGQTILPHTEVKRLLDLVRSAAKPCDPDSGGLSALQPAHAGWPRDERYSDLLAAAIRSMVQVKEEKDLDSLFTGPKTTALTGPITGLDDFELIAFLVVEPTGGPA